MNSRDPKLITLLFNESINNRDIEGLAALMTNNHTLITRDGTVNKMKDHVTECWERFFHTFPEYKNTFTRIESRDDHVMILGFAFWSAEQPFDQVIWTAKIEDNLVDEWRIYHDTEENRNLLGFGSD